MDTKVISVNAILGDMHDLLIKSLTLRVKIKLSLNENVWLININTDELEDAIVNLALNARDAMPEGGSLVIETTNALLDEEYAGRNPGVEPGEYVSVSVSDTGFGMDQKTLEHVYEPFFTTKEEERGTGLGLSMVYGFIKRSKGHMKIDSEPGHGTTVSMTLPITLAIVQSLIVVVGGQRFAIPVTAVFETLLVDPAEIQRSEGRELLNLRGEPLLLRRLAVEFGLLPAPPDAKQFVVVTGMGDARIGLLVERLEGEQDTVIKPIQGPASEVRGIAGATELGDRGAVLVLDVFALVDELAERREVAA